MVSKKTIRKILVHWGKEKDTVSDVYYEGSGQLSENDFYVGKEWILKISDMPGRPERHVRVSKALKKSGLAVSLSLPSLEGSVVVQEGELFCILCQRVKGTRLSSRQLFSENFEDQEEHIRKWIVLYKEILKGYDTVLHLTEAEKDAAPYVVFSIQLICAAYFSSKDKFADLARVNKKMLLYLMEHAEELFII